MEFLRSHPEILLIGGLLLITAYFMSRLARRKRSGGVSILTPHEQLERIRQAKGMRGDLEQLMVEIEQLAKRMGAQLDAKAVRLEKLIDDADDRLQQLAAMQASSTPRRTTPGVEPSADSVSSPAHAELPRRPRSSFTSPEKPVVPASKAAAAQLPDDPLARSVYERADQGLSSQQIARELQEHVGKVELILALRNA